MQENLEAGMDLKSYTTGNVTQLLFNYLQFQGSKCTCSLHDQTEIATNIYLAIK
jgi:hypothetical protein